MTTKANTPGTSHVQLPCALLLLFLKSCELWSSRKMFQVFCRISFCRRSWSLGFFKPPTAGWSGPTRTPGYLETLISNAFLFWQILERFTCGGRGSFLTSLLWNFCQRKFHHWVWGENKHSTQHFRPDDVGIFWNGGGHLTCFHREGPLKARNIFTCLWRLSRSVGRGWGALKATLSEPIPEVLKGTRSLCPEESGRRLPIATHN